MKRSDKTTQTKMPSQLLTGCANTNGAKSADKAEALIEIGKVVGVWGVKGWIKIHSYTRKRDGIGKYKNWILQPANKGGSANQISVTVKTCRLQGKGVVAKLTDMDDRNIAHSFIGHKIFIESSQLPKLPQGEYYWHQLVGLDVLNMQGESLGRVDSMMETGANDVFLTVDYITDESGNQQRIERLIPQVEHVVIEVDAKANILKVDWDKDFLL